MLECLQLLSGSRANTVAAAAEKTRAKKQPGQRAGGLGNE
jgi:hypothetical protein